MNKKGGVLYEQRERLTVEKRSECSSRKKSEEAWLDENTWIRRRRDENGP